MVNADFPHELFEIRDLNSGSILTLHHQNCIDVQVENNMIVSAGEDGTIKFWEISTGNCIKSLQLPLQFESHCLGGGCKVVAFCGKIIHIWDWSTGKHFMVPAEGIHKRCSFFDTGNNFVMVNVDDEIIKFSMVGN